MKAKLELFLCLAAVSLFLSCSQNAIRPYREAGRPNLKITLDAGEDDSTKKRVEVDVSQVIPPCGYRYLGTTRVKNHEAGEIALPEDGELLLRANYTEASRIANDVANSSQLFRFAPEKGAIYELEVIEKDVHEQMDLYRVGASGRMKVESQGPVPCHHLKEVD